MRSMVVTHAVGGRWWLIRNITELKWGRIWPEYESSKCSGIRFDPARRLHSSAFVHCRHTADQFLGVSATYTSVPLAGVPRHLDGASYGSPMRHDGQKKFGNPPIISGLQWETSSFASCGRQPRAWIGSQPRSLSSVSHVTVKWSTRTFDFYVCRAEPDGHPQAFASTVIAVKALGDVVPDVVFLSIGYLDVEKILETFKPEAVLSARKIEPINDVITRDNGQFIPIIQQMMINKIPFYPIGRGRLVEMGALGRELLWRPVELITLIKQLLFGAGNHSVPAGQMTRSLRKVLAEDSAEYFSLKLHQYLLEWTVSDYSCDEPFIDYSEKSFLEKWVFGRNQSEIRLRIRAKQAERFRSPLPQYAQHKKNLRVLVLCDAATEKSVIQNLCTALPTWERRRPSFTRMFDLENTSSTRFHLCLALYIVLPLLTVARQLWKLMKWIWLEVWVKGRAVSVGGDDFVATAMESSDITAREKMCGQMHSHDLQVEKGRWFGLSGSVHDQSRD